ncbi:MAG: protein phosphatase 2C domain-containing protein [Candidatus Levybacteria bacterium]|nr:protein phosphatase 2C domain-containing protein [Candidatus Levybacteria bacterium]
MGERIQADGIMIGQIYDEQAPQVVRLEKKAAKPKPECEDAGYTLIDATRGLFIGVVTDGISSYKYDPEKNYSPGARASRSVAKTLGEELTAIAKEKSDKGIEITKDDFKKAFQLANKVVRIVNEQEEYQTPEGKTTSLWELPDYYEHDLAGAVAAAVIQQGNTLYYGFIGDCRILILSSDGEVKWQSLTEETNKIHQAQQNFASLRRNLPPKEDLVYQTAWINYVRTVHTQFRNNPAAERMKNGHATYGVLNGQPEALDDSYLITGVIEYASEDHIVLCSDGLEPYIDNEEFKKLLISGDREKIEYFLDTHMETDTVKDDKLLIVY